MFFYRSSKTSTSIVKILLLSQSLTALQIQKKLQELGHSLKTSGLYKALALLREQGVLLRVRGKFLINNEWKNAIYELLGSYGTLTLKDQESINIICKTASQIDLYWKHYSFILESEAQLEGFYFYNPHQFWIYVVDRAQSEKDFILYTKRKRLRVKHIIGNNGEYDKHFARIYKSSTYEVHCSKVPSFSKRDNIAVFGDFVLNTKTSSTIADQIEHAYTTAKNEKHLANMVSDILKKPSRYVFTLQRNRALAGVIRKRFKKFF